jgi:hypothetical protein
MIDESSSYQISFFSSYQPVKLLLDSKLIMTGKDIHAHRKGFFSTTYVEILTFDIFQYFVSNIKTLKPVKYCKYKSITTFSSVLTKPITVNNCHKKFILGSRYQRLGDPIP